MPRLRFGNPFLSALPSLALSLSLALTLPAQSFAADAPAAPAGTGRIPAGDGIELFYQVEGKGTETLVVLHGGPGFNSAYLQPDMQALSRYRRVIYYDQRGAGRSTVTSDAALVNLDKHVADLETVRAYFKLDRFDILGHSWGAALGAHYALKYPGHVNRLVMVDAMPPRRTPWGATFATNVRSWMDDETKKKLEALAAARREAADPAAACRDYYAVFIRGYLADPKGPLPSAKGSVCDAPPEAIRNSARVNALTTGPLGDWDWREPIAKLDAKLIVIHGDRDPIPLDSAKEWADSVRGGKLIVIKGSGHFPFIEQPKDFFATMDEALKKN